MFSYSLLGLCIVCWGFVLSVVALYSLSGLCMVFWGFPLSLWAPRRRWRRWPKAVRAATQAPLLLRAAAVAPGPWQAVSPPGPSAGPLRPLYGLYGGKLYANVVFMKSI